MWGMLMTGRAKLRSFQSVLMQLLVLLRRIISIFANRAF